MQDRSSRRTFVSTGAGYRIEVHPPRPWIEELVADRNELAVADLRLRTSEPHQKASALADLLGLEAARGGTVQIGDAQVQFLPGGPEGRPSCSPSASRSGSRAAARAVVRWRGATRARRHFPRMDRPGWERRRALPRRYRTTLRTLHRKCNKFVTLESVAAMPAGAFGGLSAATRRRLAF